MDFLPEKVLFETASKKIFDIVLPFFKGIGKFAVEEISIHSATSKYADSYLRRYGNVKVLGMSEPLSLQELYTKVQVVNPAYRFKEQIIKDMEVSFRKERNFSSFAPQRLSGLKLANEKNRLNVLGAPGSGKSTFLRKMGLESMINYYIPPDEVYEHNCIPVLIELSRFKNEPNDVIKLIAKEFQIAGFPDATKFTDKVLQDGKLLILLDGLDEVPEAILSNVLDQIKDFTDTYSKNRFISSCRTAFYKNYLNGFTDVEISPFDNFQIEIFIQNWFSLEKDQNAGTGTALKYLLHKPENAATLELARTPLLLTFLCITFDNSQKFPANRTSLYKRALNILMERWAAEKRIHNEDIYHDLTNDLELEMLASIAASYYERNQIFFQGQDLKLKIREFLDGRISSSTLDISKILEAIEIQQGILTERSADVYSFSHLTLQEYLTAHYYYTPLKIHQLVNNFFYDNRWREVFLLITGISDPNDTLELMAISLKKYLTNQSLVRNIAKWLTSLNLISEDVLADSFYRVFFASILIRYKRYKYASNVDDKRMEKYADQLMQQISADLFDRLSPKIKPTMNKRQAGILFSEVNKRQLKKTNFIPNVKTIENIKPKKPLSTMLPGSQHAFRSEIIDEVFKTLKISEAINSKQKSFYDPLLKYFEAFALLIECAKSSPLVRTETLHKIYTGLLTNGTSAED